MKKPLTGLIWLLAGAFTAHSQGTVSLANYLALTTYIYVSFKPLNGPAVELGGTMALGRGLINPTLGMAMTGPWLSTDMREQMTRQIVYRNAPLRGEDLQPPHLRMG
ncbi:MAG TPA: hypothetical protein VH595_10460 [Verrucomicrobiae bacterium]|nr:hypothetical protein [Verrucomicrobiae bacterium]